MASSGTSGRQSLYGQKKERRRLVEDALENQEGLLRHDENDQCQTQCDATDTGMSHGTPTSKFVKTIVGVVNVPSTKKRSVACQANLQPPRPPHRSERLQCTLVSHQFTNLAPDEPLAGNLTDTGTGEKSVGPDITSPPILPVDVSVEKVENAAGPDVAIPLVLPVDLNVEKSNIGNAAGPDMPDLNIPDLNIPPITSTPKKRRIQLDDDEEEDASQSFIDDEKKDPTWNADLSVGEMKEPDVQCNGSASDTVKLYVVSERKLLSLFQICQKCGKEGAEANVTSVMGTLITITQECLSCDEVTKWTSQDMIGSYPAGNISLSTALLCSGNVPSKALRMLEFWGVQCFTPQTFCAHQRKFINQAVHNVWEDEVITVMSNLNEVVQLSGDARCDSMGHCAKYGTYSLHDKDSNAIICTELVVSTEPESKKSAAMEVLGLSRALDVVENYCPHLQIKLVTDGHTGVAKHIRDERAGSVTHYLDIWHVAKGIKKRMSKWIKKFPQIAMWKRSIINHLYWSAISSNNNGALIVAKWKSLANHVANIHEHESELFPSCSHGNIGPRCWFDPASDAYDTLCDKVIMNKAVLKSVERLSSDAQTSGLEGFHSTINQFAPKMYHFGYQSMKSRVELAALHFNENSKRGAKTKGDGNALYNIRFPKSRGGQYIVVQVMKNPTYRYANKVKQEVVRLVKSGMTYEQTDNPPLLCSIYERPASKDQAVSEHRTRFKRD